MPQFFSRRPAKIYTHISIHTRWNTSSLSSATAACTLFIKGGQPKLKTARNRRHMNNMQEGATGIQNELQASIKTSNIMNVVQGVGRTKYNQTQWQWTGATTISFFEGVVTTSRRVRVMISRVQMKSPHTSIQGLRYLSMYVHMICVSILAGRLE